MGKKCIGVDVGGTSVKLGIFDVDGVLLKKWEIPTRKEEHGKYVLDDIAASIRETLKDENISMEDVVGVGIDVPGPVKKNGYVEVCVNLGWRDIYPAKELSARLDGIPAECGNDANAAAIGEMTYGAARGMKDFIMITLGTGVGSGIVINGQMVYGHDGFAGELGHVIARRDGRICGCGRKGCLETYCSATGVARTAREFLAARTDASLLRNIPAESITSKDVYDAAVQGDKLAQEIFEFTGNILGEALADAIAFSSPEAIVLFGGLAKSGDYIMKPIMKSIDDNVLNIYKGKTKLLVSELKDSDAAVLGASALAWELKDIKE